MRTIEIRVPEASFADILNSMREWLDREKYPLSHFRRGVYWGCARRRWITCVSPVALTGLLTCTKP